MDRVIQQDIVDQKIINRPYATRIVDFVLDSKGRAWWIAQGTLPATVMLNQFDTVEFWADGVRYEGFLPAHPQGQFIRSQGSTSMTWAVTVWFLKVYRG